MSRVRVIAGRLDLTGDPLLEAMASLAPGRDVIRADIPDRARAANQRVRDREAGLPALPDYAAPFVEAAREGKPVGLVHTRKGPAWTTELPLHRTEAGWPNCSTCDGGGCPDCTDPA